jgi:hypothetical protein
VLNERHKKEEYAMHGQSQFQKRVRSGALAIVLMTAAIGCGSSTPAVGQSADELKGGNGKGKGKEQGGAAGSTAHGQGNAHSQAGQGSSVEHSMGNGHNQAGQGSEAEHGQGMQHGQAGAGSKSAHGQGKAHGHGGTSAEEQEADTETTLTPKRQ